MIAALRAMDMVKFANASISENAIHELISKAEHYVRRTSVHFTTGQHETAVNGGMDRRSGR
jgi:uncharacterized protein YqgV (UPF0045/DUF77 family)